jgi:hypothetical protein
VHQVVHVYFVFQEDALIFEDIFLKDLLLHPTTLRHLYLILRVLPVRYREILILEQHHSILTPIASALFFTMVTNKS